MSSNNGHQQPPTPPTATPANNGNGKTEPSSAAQTTPTSNGNGDNGPTKTIKPTSHTEQKPPAFTKPLTLNEKFESFGESFLKTCMFEEHNGDARILAQLLKGRLVFDPAYEGGKSEVSGWFVWEGQNWRRTRSKSDILRFGAFVAQQYRYLAAELETEIAALKKANNKDEATKKEDLQRSCNARARRQHLKGHFSAVLTYAESYLATPRKADDTSVWDVHPWLIAAPNGVVDLRTGDLAPGKPEDYLSVQIPTAYKPDAKAPKWEKFIAQILGGDAEVVSFVQRLFGYSLTGSHHEHILPIFFGPDGRNGKDTLLKAIGHVLGHKTARAVDHSVILEQKNTGGNATPHLAELQGLRWGWVSETSNTAYMNANQVKLITGGGQIKARGLYEGLRTFIPTHTIYLLTNHKPRIPSGGDKALWARLRLIEFNQRFLSADDPDYDPSNPNHHLADKGLEDALKEEAEGILAWIVRGTIEWWNDGQPDLKTPESVKLATIEYAQEEDAIQQFLDEHCIIIKRSEYDSDEAYQKAVDSVENRVASSLLYNLFKESGGKLSQRYFSPELEKRGFEKIRHSTGWYFHGLRVWNDDDGNDYTTPVWQP